MPYKYCFSTRSKISLTHHRLINRGAQNLQLGLEYDKLQPLTDTGSGQVREKEKAYLAESISKVNELFVTETSDGDKLAWLNTKKEKLLENAVLIQQAHNNSRDQFAGSPDLQQFFIDALIEAAEAPNKLDLLALGSKEKQAEILSLLLGPGKLYEALRERALNLAE